MSGAVRSALKAIEYFVRHEPRVHRVLERYVKPEPPAPPPPPPPVEQVDHLKPLRDLLQDSLAGNWTVQQHDWAQLQQLLQGLLEGRLACTVESVGLLRALLQFTGQIYWSISPDLQVTSPEDALRIQAARILGKHAGRACLANLEDLQNITPSPLVQEEVERIYMEVLNSPEMPSTSVELTAPVPEVETAPVVLDPRRRQVALLGERLALLVDLQDDGSVKVHHAPLDKVPVACFSEITTPLPEAFVTQGGVALLTMDESLAGVALQITGRSPFLKIYRGAGELQVAW